MTTTVDPAPDRLPAIRAAGVGFKAEHAVELLAARPAVGFLEVHAENYLGGGAQLRRLEAARALWPVSVHAVGLSLGGADGVDLGHLERVHALVERIEPALVSDHLAWSGIDGVYFNDLLPLPYTEEALAVVARNVERVQERLGRAIMIENPSRYLRFACSPIPEFEFLAELTRRTGCGLLCDVNNLFVSCANVGGDAAAELQALPAAAVGEIHIAGHAVADADGALILIDDHGSRVADAVWALFEQAVARFPQAPALVEWDTDVPPLAALVEEAAIADRRRARALENPCHAAAA